MAEYLNRQGMWGVYRNDEIMTSQTADRLELFKDTFNLNKWEGMFPPLLFRISEDMIAKFPQNFKLNLELTFEGGYTVNASARGTRKVQ